MAAGRSVIDRVVRKRSGRGQYFLLVVGSLGLIIGLYSLIYHRVFLPPPETSWAEAEQALFRTAAKTMDAREGDELKLEIARFFALARDGSIPYARANEVVEAIQRATGKPNPTRTDLNEPLARMRAALKDEE